MATYTIQCYIETLSSDDKVTLHGCEGFRLLREEKNDQNKTIQKIYLIFFENGKNASKPLIIEQSKIFDFQFPHNSPKNSKQSFGSIMELHFKQKMETMLLAAQMSHKKVELKVELINEKTMLILKIKLMG